MAAVRSAGRKSANVDTRYASLDGLRGIAAILVAVFHLQQRLGHTPINGYLAVDLFFVLSGFVLAKIYESQLASGLGALKFTVHRFIRFYPLYLAGFVVGLCWMFFAGPHELSGFSQSDRIAALLFGGLLLPNPTTPLLFPLNGAAWSLFFELGVNALFATLLWRLRKRWLLITAAAAFAALCFSIPPPRYLNIGWAWEDFAGGCARTIFSFTIGILIARLLPDRSRRETPLAFLLLAAAGFAIFFGFGDPTTWMIASAAVAFPAVVTLAAAVEPPAYARRAMFALGALSFPLYAIHWPLAALLAPWLRSLPFSQAAAIFIGIASCLAFLAQRFVDQPGQRLLRRWARPRYGSGGAGITTTSLAVR